VPLTEAADDGVAVEEPRRRQLSKGIIDMTNHDLTSNDLTNHDDTTTKAGGKRRGAAIGLAGGLLAGTAAGLVFAVPGLTSASNDAPPPPAAATATAAEQVGDDADVPATAPAELGVHLRDTLQALVDDGTLTTEQADAVSAYLVESRPERGESGERGGLFGRGVRSEALTDLLGLDAQELREQVRDGATLAEIAAAQGVETQTVVDELVAELTERVGNAVENGLLDQSDVDEKLADAVAKITDMVNNGRPD
jgi:polyhydroxyalkanoate synthesis regulator phasin